MKHVGRPKTNRLWRDLNIISNFVSLVPHVGNERSDDRKDSLLCINKA